MIAEIFAGFIGAIQIITLIAMIGWFLIFLYQQI